MSTARIIQASSKLDYLLESILLFESIIMTAKGWTASGNEAYLEAKLKYVSFERLRNEVTKITDQQLQEIKDNYMSASSLRWFTNSYLCRTSSGASQAVQDASSHLTSNEERAQLVVGYMCNKKNWNLGFCRFIWDEHLTKKILLPIKNEEKKEGIERESSAKSVKDNVEPSVDTEQKRTAAGSAAIDKTDERKHTASANVASDAVADSPAANGIVEAHPPASSPLTGAASSSTFSSSASSSSSPSSSSTPVAAVVSSTPAAAKAESKSPAKRA